MATKNVFDPKQIEKAGITAVWGGRGSGKTTFAKTKIMPLVASQRIIVIDPMAPDGHATAHDFAVALYGGERHVTLASGNPSEVIPALYVAWAHSTPTDPIYAFCDEAPEYLAKSTAGINKIMFQGRHRAFGMLLIGQRVRAISPQVRSQASTSFFMRMKDEVDLDVVRKSIGSEPTALLKEFGQGDFFQH